MAEKENRKVIDFHVHLVGIGTNGSGCLASRKKWKFWLFQALLRNTGLSYKKNADALDRAYLVHLLTLLKTASHIDGCLLLGMDKPFLDDGTPDERNVDLYVPNRYLLDICAAHEGLFYAGVSIHPYRPDALDALANCIEAGARAVKWLPVYQNINPADRRCFPFYDLLVTHQMPLLVHTGGEHTLRAIRKEFADPVYFRSALERGVTLVMAHCGTGNLGIDKSYFRTFCNLVRKYPRAFGDISGCAVPLRAPYLQKMAGMEELHTKLVHGSDFPVPSHAWWFLSRLGWRLCRNIGNTRNILERDYLIKKYLGFSSEVFTRGAALLSV